MFHFHASFAFYLWCLDPERREMSWRASGPGGSSKIPPLLPKVSLPSSELQAGLHGGLFGCKGSLTLRLAGGPPRLSLLHVLASLHVLAQIRSERALPRRCRVWASQGDLWRENILSKKDASSARVSVPSQHLICTQHLHTLRLFFSTCSLKTISSSKPKVGFNFDLLEKSLPTKTTPTLTSKKPPISGGKLTCWRLWTIKTVSIWSIQDYLQIVTKERLKHLQKWLKSLSEGV